MLRESVDDGCASFEAIGLVLGVTRQRVQQLEQAALIKVRVAMALESMLGPKLAAPVLASLRGKSVQAFRDAYKTAKESMCTSSAPTSA